MKLCMKDNKMNEASKIKCMYENQQDKLELSMKDNKLCMTDNRMNETMYESQ